MNPLNYCTQPYAQKLHDAGIVIKTDYGWAELPNYYVAKDGSYPLEWRLVDKPHSHYKHPLPAPCFVEVWRELPERAQIKKYLNRSVCEYNNHCFENTNPTDAAIELLVWVKGREYERN